MANRKLVVEVIGDSSSLEKALAKSNKSVNRFGRNLDQTGKKSRGVFGGIGKTIGLATGALGAIGLAGAAKAAFVEMGEAQKATAQLNAGIKSTEGVANVTTKSLEKHADALMRLSGIDDEEIKSGQAVLLTFKKVRNEAGKGNKIFSKATELALDLSVRFKKDLKGSALLVGKALEDPIKGLSSLSRVGVQFSGKQKTMIKTLVATGKTMEAQKIILAELETQVGGSAKAFGGTLPQKINLLKESLLNLGGALAQKLAPEITKIVDKITDWLSKTENQERIMDAVKTASEVLAGAFGFLRGAFKKLNSITGSTKNSLILLLGALAAFKTIQILGRLAHIARAVGMIGGKADTAIGTTDKGVKGLNRHLNILKGIGAIAVGITLAVAIYESPEYKRFVAFWHSLPGIIGKLPINIAEIIGILKAGPTGKGFPGGPGTKGPGSTGGRFGTPTPPPPPAPRPPTHGPPVGTRSLQGATVVNVGTVVTQDPDKFVRDMQKRAARSRAQQRGVRPGVNLGGA